MPGVLEPNLLYDHFRAILSRKVWLAANPPNRANQRNVSEMSRLFDTLAEVVPAPQIGPWLDTPKPEVLQLCSYPVIGCLDASPGLFSLRSFQVAAI
jgi:hypothetical protein